jgi:hypothetical protein
VKSTSHSGAAAASQWQVKIISARGFMDDSPESWVSSSEKNWQRVLDVFTLW